MALFNQVQSGLIFFDDFTEGQLDIRTWTMSPSDPTRFNLTSGRLTLYPDDEGTDTLTMLLLPTPTADDFVLEVSGQFTPSPYGDMAGLIAFETRTDSVAILQYYDSTTGPVTYTHLRLQFKNTSYYAWGSSDGGLTYQLIGSSWGTIYPSIGLVIYPPTIIASTPQATPQVTPQTTPQATPSMFPVTSPYVIDYVRVYIDTSFTVTNLTPGYQVELLDQNQLTVQTVIVSAQQQNVVFDLSRLSMPFSGYLRVTDTLQNITQSSLLTIWGGDIYWFGIRLQLSWNNIPYTESNNIYLGMMQAGIINTEITITNIDSFPANNVLITVDASPGVLGSSWVQVASDNGGIAGTYGTSAVIGTINAGQTISAWILITRNTTEPIFFDSSQYKFRLVITSD